jgi:hypothetical protein
MRPVNRALPCRLSGTTGVSRIASALSPGLQTRVPVTAVIGPAVPLNIDPLITSPSTSKEAVPLPRSTVALPARAVHGNVPLLIWLTGLSTFTALITPAMPFQVTTRSTSWALAPPHACSKKAADEDSDRHNNAHTLFMISVPFIRTLNLEDQDGSRIDLPGRDRQSTKRAEIRGDVAVTYRWSFGPSPVHAR